MGEIAARVKRRRRSFDLTRRVLRGKRRAERSFLGIAGQSVSGFSDNVVSLVRTLNLVTLPGHLGARYCSYVYAKLDRSRRSAYVSWILRFSPRAPNTHRGMTHRRDDITRGILPKMSSCTVVSSSKRRNFIFREDRIRGFEGRGVYTAE